MYIIYIYLCFELNEVDWFIHPLQMVTLQYACEREGGGINRIKEINKKIKNCGRSI